MKNNFKWFLYSSIVLLLLSACGMKETESEFPSKINIGIIRVPNDKQVAISMEIFDTYFKNKGIQTNFLFFDSGVAANQAFASGSIDFAEMGYTNGVVALSKELPVELIWIHDVLGKNEALVVQEESSITTIQDLKGKKIATPFSSTSHFSLLKTLEDAGIQNEVEILDMETADIVAAWERKDIDATYTWEPSLSRVKETGRVLITSEELADKGIMTTNIELVHQNFAKKYPDLVIDYLACLQQGHEYFVTNQKETASIVAKDLNLTDEEVLNQMQASKWLTAQEQVSSDYLGTNAEPGQFHHIFIDTIDFLLTQKAINDRPSEEVVHQFINSSYAEKLVERK